MEIVFFVYEFPPYVVGGLGTYAEYVTRELVRMGHDVTVFSMHTKDAPTRDVYKGVEVHRPIVEDINISLLLPMFIPEEVRKWSKEGQRFFGDIFLYNVLSSSKLVNDLVRTEKRRVDLVVAHDWLGSVGGVLASGGLNKPMAFHVHSTEQGRAGNGSDCVKRLERIAADHAERVVTVSYAMRDHLVRLGYDERKIRVVYNGIDPERYSPERVPPEEAQKLRRTLGIQDDEYMILFVGRLNWVKGADTLLQAMPDILDSVPKAKLVIVGVGDQEEMLKQEVQRLNLEGKVILKYEFLPEDLKIKYYAASDVCVFPSKYEPFGIVCTEAMAMGKPLVVGARGVSGMREQVIPSGPNQCGFHINPYDPSDIAKFVTILLEDDELRRRCGENARNRVLKVFTWRNVAENTVRVYNEIVPT
ncbi:MAG: glycosyl transferase family 1 [Candidatus Bathyarchaeota archaeon B26-2]|nr:MAG: glycosyl transferase family 1 [Candidatus Bathyarchaeota archaeon B26-2]